MYIGETPENKHPKKPWEQHLPKYTSSPKTDSFTKTTTEKTIYNTIHRHYSPSKKKHLSKLNSQSWTSKLIHIRKAPIRKIIQLPPPLDLRSTERNHKKPNTKLEPKNWLPISNQKWSVHQTLGPNQKGTPHPWYTKETLNHTKQDYR